MSASRNGVRLVKSGTDFRDLGEIVIEYWPPCPPTDAHGRSDEEEKAEEGGDSEGAVSRGEVLVGVRHISVGKAWGADREIEAIVDRYDAMLGSAMDRVIGETVVPLDARFAAVRTRETNVGNLLADLMRESLKADVSLLNSGTIRTDDVLSPGPLLLRHLVTLLPM